MQTPICTFCAKTNVLCGHCEKKLKEGKISQTDIEISKYLYDKYPELNLEYVSSFITKDMAILFFKGNIGPIVGKGGREVLELGKKIGKRIKIINLDADIKKIISDIIYPVTLVGINTIFTNDGEISKIRLAKSDLMRIPFDINSLEKILFNLLNKKIRVAFE